MLVFAVSNDEVGRLGLDADDVDENVGDDDIKRKWNSGILPLNFLYPIFFFSNFTRPSPPLPHLAL